MEDYGVFQDQGVHGTTSSYIENAKVLLDLEQDRDEGGGLTDGIQNWVQLKKIPLER